MSTVKQLVINALTRTGDPIVHDAPEVPPDRWQESPAGQAKSLRQVLEHLIQCEDWWLINLGVPEQERPPVPDLTRPTSAREMAGLFRAAREHLIGVVHDLPDGFFDNPVPACHYGGLRTGADLLLYAAEHTFYHDGQIQMLELAFRSGS